MKKLLLGLAAALLIAPVAQAESEFSVTLQGGATKNNQALDGADTGVNYGARLGIMPTKIVGVELGYLGSQNNISESLEAGRGASTLRTNTGYGDIRVNLLPGPVTPYAFGGYGLTWVNGAAASGIPNRNVNTLPFGGGLDVNVGNFKVGGRFQYNYLFDNIYTGSNTNNAGVAVNKGGSSDFYGVSLGLGASFH